jgi:transposase
MESDAQLVLFADVRRWRSAEPEDSSAAPADAARQPRVRWVNRSQLIMRAVDVEQLVGPDHPARAIWELMGAQDLTRFYGRIEATAGVAGRPARDPRLLLSVWIYAYMEGICSAREIERQFDFNPAFQWLTGATTLSAHSLSDFRMNHADDLKHLGAQILALLAAEGMVDLEQVTLDGTKVRASAGADTFRREKTIERLLGEARQRIEELESGDQEETSRRSLQARQRGARERLQRLELARRELSELQQARAAKEKSEVRVSVTDPESRIMKQNNGGYGPSYNVQITTDAKQKLIVGVTVTQDGGDGAQLQPAMERLEQEAGKLPRQAIVDGGYTNRENIVKTAAKNIDLIGPPLEAKVQKETLYQIRGVAPAFRPEAFRFDQAANTYTCPEGKTLPYKTRNTMVGQIKYTYAADVADCAACAQKARCCPSSTQGRLLVRAEDTAEVAAFREKMQTEQAKSTYAKRGQVAEFPNLWIKTKFGLRQFSVRGLEKVRIEALWAIVTYNVHQLLRLRRAGLAVAN